MVEAVVLRALRPKHLLFLCVANSARSQMAEGLARRLARGQVRISSAGSSPTFLRSEAELALAEIGIDLSSHRSKRVDDIDLRSVDAAIALCTEEICPVLPRPVPMLHWGFSDPGSVKGKPEERLEAFRHTRDELQKRLERLFADPSVPRESTDG
jgi:arsenate reductase